MTTKTTELVAMNLMARARTEADGRAAYLALCEECGTDRVAEEQAVLSVGREFLPPEALTVLDGGEPTLGYWEFLAGQTGQAQAEHDAEVAS